MPRAKSIAQKKSGDKKKITAKAKKTSSVKKTKAKPGAGASKKSSPKAVAGPKADIKKKTAKKTAKKAVSEKKKTTVKKTKVVTKSKKVSKTKKKSEQKVTKPVQRAKSTPKRKIKKLNIAICASEALPFVKTGGLADVIGSLPVELKKMGHNVIVLLPEYLKVHESNFNLQDTGIRFSSPVGSDWLDISLSKAEYKGVDFYFVKYPPYFMRPGLYGEAGGYEDNLERFTLFSKACIEALVRIDFKPDIIHCNDWHTGLVPVFLKSFYADSPFFKNTKTVFTIHNIAYQGIFGVEKFYALGLDWSYFTHQALEFYGKINLLKAGIIFADKITTVSPQFAKEIQTPDFGYGLDGVLRSRKQDLYGILNGIDTEEWNPWNDPFISENFGIKAGKAYLKGKAVCKVALLEECGLSPNERPVFAMVSRLSEQKGIDILVDAMMHILSEKDIYFILLGTGDSYYEQSAMGLQHKFPEKAKSIIDFDNALAHKIYAGADFFLMPSRYEPCGLSQMISMRYATLPIVRECGGLKDTVPDNVGFLFKEHSPVDLKSEVEKAVDLYYNDKRGFNNRRKKGLSLDFSWEASAKAYNGLYASMFK